MTVDRKRLRELARRMRIWWKPGALQLIGAGHSVDADIDACADGIDALLDALDAAEQRAPDALAERVEKLEALLRESRESIGGDWRERRDRLLAAPTAPKEAT